MFKNDLEKNRALKEKAYNEFKRVVALETANGAETLSLFRLARNFSTAPKEDTDNMLVVFRYWSRKGDQEALLQYGEELRNWTKDNGFIHS